MADPTSRATVGEEPEAGVLYLVPTPLGHRGDLSARAAHILSEVDVLLCEDTRVTRKLLAELRATPELVSCHDHNERQRVGSVVKWLASDRRVALVSDAGTPLVSDPGFAVVQGVSEAGFRVLALPGPCAATTALSASGLPPDRFSFVGFLPRKTRDRATLLQSVEDRTDTLIFYCSCHRLREDLEGIRGQLGNRRASAARDLTKRGELHLRGTLATIVEELSQWDRITGEWTVCVEGTSSAPASAGIAPEVVRMVEAMVAAGMSPRAVRDHIAEVTGLSKKEVYKLALAASDQA